jgi:hypothetical protein
MFKNPINFLTLIVSLGTLSSCALVSDTPRPTLDAAKTISIASGCHKMIRFHQGITAFDNVHREEDLPSVNQALVKAFTKEVSGRFKVVPAQIPEVYTKRHRGFSVPVFTPVQGTDAVLTIMPWLTGTSEPEIATQGYGIRSARIGRGASAFANLDITVYDARTTKPVYWIYVRDVCPLVGVDWRSNWSEYTPAERAEIERGLNLIFQRTAEKLKAKMTPLKPKIAP